MCSPSVPIAYLPSNVITDDFAGTGKKRPAKPQVKTACVNCKKAHLACDLSRPCKRCVSSDKADSCHDIQHKKRGRPKLRAMKSHQVSLPSTHSSLFTMTAPDHEQQQQQQSLSHHPPMSSTMTMFLSMELCCARVSDESFDYLGLYPQEFSHRSLYDFIHPRHSSAVARIHRCLLDNAVTFSSHHSPQSHLQRNQTRLLPPTQRTTADMFTTFSPYQLLTIANGSLTLKESLLFATSDQSRHQSLDARFYLGGGSGADLDHPGSLPQLYIVCSLTMPQKDDEEAGLPPLFADSMALTATLQPILFSSSPSMLAMDPIVTSDHLTAITTAVASTTSVPSPTIITSPFSLPSATTAASSHTDSSSLSSSSSLDTLATTLPATALETPAPSITLPMKPSSHHQGTPPRHGPPHQRQPQQQPHQLYYQTMLSSRLSGEAQAFASTHRSAPVMSTPPYNRRSIRHLFPST